MFSRKGKGTKKDGKGKDSTRGSTRVASRAPQAVASAGDREAQEGRVRHKRTKTKKHEIIADILTALRNEEASNREMGFIRGSAAAVRQANDQTNIHDLVAALIAMATTYPVHYPEVFDVSKRVQINAAEFKAFQRQERVCTDKKDGYVQLTAKQIFDLEQGIESFITAQSHQKKNISAIEARYLKRTLAVLKLMVSEKLDLSEDLEGNNLEYLQSLIPKYVRRGHEPIFFPGVPYEIKDARGEVHYIVLSHKITCYESNDPSKQGQYTFAAVGGKLIGKGGEADVWPLFKRFKWRQDQFKISANEASPDPSKPSKQKRKLLKERRFIFETQDGPREVDLSTLQPMALQEQDVAHRKLKQNVRRPIGREILLPDGSTEKVLHTTMERYQGATLREILTSGKVLDLEFILSVVRQVAEQLKMLHRDGSGDEFEYVLMDLKPANIFITNEGKAIILDCGMVERVERGQYKTISRDRLGGTEVYASPEAFGNTQAFGKASDVFTLGIVMIELLSQQLQIPNLGAEKVAELQQILNVLIIACVKTKPEERMPIGQLVEFLNTAHSMLLSVTESQTSSAPIYDADVVLMGEGIDYQNIYHRTAALARYASQDIAEMKQQSHQGAVDAATRRATADPRAMQQSMASTRAVGRTTVQAASPKAASTSLADLRALAGELEGNVDSILDGLESSAVVASSTQSTRTPAPDSKKSKDKKGGAAKSRGSWLSRLTGRSSAAAAVDDTSKAGKGDGHGRGRGQRDQSRIINAAAGGLEQGQARRPDPRQTAGRGNSSIQASQHADLYEHQDQRVTAGVFRNQSRGAGTAGSSSNLAYQRGAGFGSAMRNLEQGSGGFDGPATSGWGDVYAGDSASTSVRVETTTPARATHRELDTNLEHNPYLARGAATTRQQTQVATMVMYHGTTEADEMSVNIEYAKFVAQYGELMDGLADLIASTEALSSDSFSFGGNSRGFGSGFGSQGRRQSSSRQGSWDSRDESLKSVPNVSDNQGSAGMQQGDPYKGEGRIRQIGKRGALALREDAAPDATQPLLSDSRRSQGARVMSNRDPFTQNILQRGYTSFWQKAPGRACQTLTTELTGFNADSFDNVSNFAASTAWAALITLTLPVSYPIIALKVIGATLDEAVRDSHHDASLYHRAKENPACVVRR